MASTRIYSDNYKKICFDAWVMNSRPTMDRLRELIPADNYDRKPNPAELRKWRKNLDWDMKADIVDAKVEEQSLDLLVQKKHELLKVQLEQVTKVSKKALDYLMAEEDGGFDSSASAVQAFYRGMEEQRKIAGFSDLLEKLESMTNNQVRDEIIALITRGADNNQIIEGTEVDDNVSTDDEE